MTRICALPTCDAVVPEGRWAYCSPLHARSIYRKWRDRGRGTVVPDKQRPAA